MGPKKIFIKNLQLICPEIRDDELKEFESELKVKYFESKEFIFDKSKTQNEILYVISGLVRSFYINEKGSEISAYFIKEFDFVSDYPAFLNATISNYTFEAIEKTTVVVIPRDLILKAYNTSLKFDRFGRLIAEQAVQFLQGRVDSFIFKTATERYLDFIEQEPDLFRRLSVEHIATYLGIERQSLTRIRKKLKDM